MVDELFPVKGRQLMASFCYIIRKELSDLGKEISPHPKGILLVPLEGSEGTNDNFGKLLRPSVLLGQSVNVGNSMGNTMSDSIRS